MSLFELYGEEDSFKHRNLTYNIIGAAIEVHKYLGPGLLESTYENCLAAEFAERKINFERQMPFSVNYKTIQLDCGYRLDFFVENRVIVELKSVDKILPIHEAQLLTYLKLSKAKIGLIINFNVKNLNQGIVRLAL